MARYGYSFPAIRGVQAGREYFASMCPIRLLPKIFNYDEEEVAPELRAQRILNRSRIPEMARYILDNPKDYVFSAITASIDGAVEFEAAETNTDFRLGTLHVDMGARILINDGQHRRAAIEVALKERPDLGDETISVVFFLDLGLERAQQMFADLNRHAIRPSKSLGVLYDHRDERAEIVRRCVTRAPLFRNLVELERTTLAPRSSKLFTLSAVYAATAELLANHEHLAGEDQGQLAMRYWEAVATQIPEWQLVRERKLTAGEVRQQYIHTHGVVLQAIGRAGAALLREDPHHWGKRIEALAALDWSRESALWAGRATVGGQVSKSRQNVLLTTNAVKNALGLSLSPEEQRQEDAFLRGDHGRN
jgi:DNA sulfur modification protein DndB